jgi:tRNA-dihydrouridine synthase B
MNKNFWRELASRWPIAALAPMDGYCDSPYRQIVKKVAPETVVFSEFYSADGLVHSKDLQKRALTHNPSEYPLIIQIFGKDPAMFAEAARIIEGYGITGIDINMGCPAKKVVKSGHGSSLMINRDTAFRIVEEMSRAVKIPVSVKTRLGWENPDLLVDFVKWLENAGANLISVHGRTYKQAFTGSADLTGIYELKQHVGIPVICNGDVMSYEDGVAKMVHPTGLKNLDGFMIWRASFGNPWCFLPGNYIPTLDEILSTMVEHGDLLWQVKWRHGMMEARKHLVQYLHGFPGVKEYRSQLVQVESPEDIHSVIESIRQTHPTLLGQKLSGNSSGSQMVTWDCGVD